MASFDIVSTEYFVHVSALIRGADPLPRRHSRRGAMWRPESVEVSYTAESGDSSGWHPERVIVRGPELRQDGSPGARLEEQNYWRRFDEMPEWLDRFVRRNLPHGGVS